MTVHNFQQLFAGIWCCQSLLTKVTGILITQDTLKASALTANKKIMYLSHLHFIPII